MAVRAFGGNRKLARALGCDAANVSRWLKTGIIPGARIPKILVLAKERNLDLTAEDLCSGRKVEASA